MTTGAVDGPLAHVLAAGNVRVPGQGLVLREWTTGDLPAMVTLFDDPDIARWTPLASPFDLDAARAYLEKIRERRLAGIRVNFAITLNGAAPLGEVLMMAEPGNPGEVEIGYGVGAAYRGQGLAVRAVKVLTSYAYETVGTSRVVLCISSGNVRSQRVARSAGFARLAGPGSVRTHSGARGTADLDVWLHQR